MASHFRCFCVGALLVMSAGQVLAEGAAKRVAYEKRWYSEDEVRALLGPTNPAYKNVFAKNLSYVYAPDVVVAPGAGYRYAAVSAQGPGGEVFTQREKTERYVQVADRACAAAIAGALVSLRADAMKQKEGRREPGSKLIIVGIQSNEFQSAPDNLSRTGKRPVNARSLSGGGTKPILCNVYKTERNDGHYDFSTVLTASGVYIENK